MTQLKTQTWMWLFWVLLATVAPTPLYSQDASPAEQTAETAPATPEDKDAPQAPTDVEIEPLAEDNEIQTRLENILIATTWFSSPVVEVDQGVVFLSGQTSKEEYRTWAGDLARNTQDVVAVVNRIQVTQRSMWDLTPAWQELQSLGRETVQMLPLLGVAVALLILTWFAARWSVGLSSRMLGRRMKNPLLVSVFSRAIAIPVFLLGLYLALRVSGLTQMAATVIGGTGLLGLMVGIAFRDIAENFAASILISVQRPFAIGDLIEVEGKTGIVQRVTTRGTQLMMPDGNHIQIPNASIYKSIIRNITANPNVRGDFAIGIDYNDSISQAQTVILKVLEQHEAVLDSPDPMVLVEELGPSTINLRIYYWVNAHTHSPIKVRSAIIRLTKLAVEDAGLTLPDESREILFPHGVPVRMLGGDEPQPQATAPQKLSPPATTTDPGQDGVRQRFQEQDRASFNDAENGLTSERETLKEQARNSRSPEEGTNLLEE